MKVLIFGATGMVGQAALRACLLDTDVSRATTIGRSPVEGWIAEGSPKLRQIVQPDLLNYAAIEDELTGFDACFFCLGVASTGMKEADYERVTYGYTLAAAETLSRLNPGMTFIYVSGSGTDSTEQGRMTWARVKGRTENALLRLPLKAYMFRPGFIEPMDGIKSKTPSYRAFYIVLKPLMPLLRWSFPSKVLSTREIGRAMLIVARQGYVKPVLETRDIRNVINSS